jgi:hypothetical protein
MIARYSFTRDPYTLTLSIPGLPKTTNAHRGKGHWARYREDLTWKTTVIGMCASAKPRVPLTRYTLTLTRFSSSEPDFDGLVSSFKVVVDALREAGVLADDRISNTGPWDCRWEKAKPKEGSIRVEVRSISSPETALAGAPVNDPEAVKG